MTDRLVFRYHPTGREFVLGWLAEYYRNPAWGAARLLTGPALVVAGLSLRATAAGGITEGLGAVAIGYGFVHLLRPLVRVGLAYHRRGRGPSHEVTVTVDQAGVRVEGAGVGAHLAWTSIDAVTRRRNRYWMTTHSGVHWSFPARAVGDEPALVRIVGERGKWRAPANDRASEGPQKVPKTPTEPGPR